ncbi:hypothetical protein DFH09DRAFT_1300064 [Mycena vulgaris]|nr:hypothetical protein DFH09DRAFT_1300064 [Mycena vulgaris]
MTAPRLLVALNLPDIVDIVSRIPPLERLGVHGSAAVFLEAGVDAFTPSALPPRLHTLDIDVFRGSLPFIRWLDISRPAISTLKSVTLHAADNLWKSGTVESFLRRAGGKLESLSLWCPCRPKDDALLRLVGVLACTTKLRDLELFVKKAVLVPNILSVLPLYEWDTISIVLGIPEYRDSITWAAIDEALADPRFRTLRRFRYSIKTATDVLSLIEPETRLLLPLANARGILE